jgi:type II pantothenate kinase
VKRASAVGVDAGASLVKLAARDAEGHSAYRLFPREAIERVAREVESAGPATVGLTGGGAAELARLLPMDTARTDEFAAWRRGAAALLGPDAADGRFLLVSLGTGTSVLLIDGAKTTRVGGTALGGGTVVGLGAGLVGTADFDTLAALARRGDRRRVDLLVSEVGDIPLPGDVTASALAKLARPPETAPREPADVAHAVMGLVGENVALVCNALAAAHGVRHVVYAGGTLRDNPALADILCGLTRVLGQRPTLLPDGEFAGALGALELARRPTRESADAQCS